MANYVSACGGHLKRWVEGYGKIKGEGARKRARDGLIDLYSSVVSVGGGEVVTVVTGDTVTVDSGTTTTFSVSTVSGDSSVASVPVVAKETAPVEVPSVPVEIEGDVGGTGMIDAVVEEKAEAPVEVVGSWPMVGKFDLIGLAPNRRTLKGRMVGDGRVVSLERNLKAWKSGDTVNAKLIRAGAFPLYRIA